MKEKIVYHLLSSENVPLLEGANVFDNSIDLVQLAKFVTDPGHEMVFAMLGTKVIGAAFGSMLLHPDKKPAFFVNEVGVNEDMRNCGIGAALTTMLMKIARDKGCHDIWLAAETDNVEARALYQKLGARETDAVVVYDWDNSFDI